MYKVFDLRCSACGQIHDGLVEVKLGQPSPNTLFENCPFCQSEKLHERLISAHARSGCAESDVPVVYGSKYDTAGYKKLPRLPQLPGTKEAQQAARQALNALPSNASKRECQEAVREACKTSPTLADYSAHFLKPEYREIEKERKTIKESNRQKRERLKAMKKDSTITIRQNRINGDPKFN